MLQDLLAILVILFFVAAKSICKASPKGYKRSEQLMRQPPGIPLKLEQQQFSIVKACPKGIIRQEQLLQQPQGTPLRPKQEQLTSFIFNFSPFSVPSSCS